MTTKYYIQRTHGEGTMADPKSIRYWTGSKWASDEAKGYCSFKNASKAAFKLSRYEIGLSIETQKRG